MMPVKLCAGTLVVETPDQVLLDYIDVRNGYAFPSYDRLVTNGSAALVDGDLLAPAPIGAEVDPRRLPPLREMLPSLAGISALPAVPLEQADDSVVGQVADLFAVLDEA